jgi:hypothetical protein
MPARLIIKKADNNVPESGNRWKAGQVITVWETNRPFTDVEAPSGGAVVHFIVSNRTVAEMEAYLSPYRREIDMTVIAGPDANGFRRVNVRNNNCNASGTVGEWTPEGTDAIIAEWNTRYPTCGLVTVAFPQPNTWTCEGTFTTGQAQEFNDTIIEKGLDITDARRIWYITPAGMSSIIANGGIQTGTSLQLNSILRDARLD